MDRGKQGPPFIRPPRRIRPQDNMLDDMLLSALWPGLKLKHHVFSTMKLKCEVLDTIHIFEMGGAWSRELPSHQGWRQSKLFAQVQAKHPTASDHLNHAKSSFRDGGREPEAVVSSILVQV